MDYQRIAGTRNRYGANNGLSSAQIRQKRFDRIAGFDENHYVTNAHFGNRDFNDMIEEFEAVREANLFLFRSLSEDDLQRKGEVNNASLSVRALLFIIVGHVKHHLKMIEERYF